MFMYVCVYKRVFRYTHTCKHTLGLSMDLACAGRTRIQYVHIHVCIYMYMYIQRYIFIRI